MCGTRHRGEGNTPFCIDDKGLYVGGAEDIAGAEAEEANAGTYDGAALEGCDVLGDGRDLLFVRLGAGEDDARELGEAWVEENDSIYIYILLPFNAKL